MKGQEADIGPALPLLLEPAEMIGEVGHLLEGAICYSMDGQLPAPHIASQPITVAGGVPWAKGNRVLALSSEVTREYDPGWSPRKSEQKNSRVEPACTSCVSSL